MRFRDITLGSNTDAGSVDRALVRAIWVTALLLALAVLTLVGAYYLQRYYRPTMSALDRDIAAVEEQIRRQPQSATLRVNAAQLYVDRGRYDEAIAQAQAVLQTAPNDFGALQALGLAYLGKNDRARAIAAFQQAVEANKDNPMAKMSRQLAGIRSYLGQAYLEDGQLEQAVAELRAAANSDGMNADTLRLLGSALLQQGDPAGAIAAFQRATRLVPDFEGAYAGLAAAYAAAGDGPGVAYANAMLSYAKGDYPTALAQLQGLAPQWADHAELHVGLALAYERNGQPDQALAEYQEALRLAPDSIAAQHGLRRVTGR